MRVRRREFIGLLGGATAWPVGGRAQDRMRRIGVLMGYAETDREGKANVAAFLGGLQRTATSGSTFAGRRPTRF